MKKQVSYNYFIDLLKFIFSVIIVFYHSWIFTGEYGAGFFNHGYLAVDFYFIVTGYLMMQSIAKEKDGNQKISNIDRFEFYERAKQAYAVIASGEEAIYANIIIKKGVIK
jgi:peptidoglycan/LPS O-acetylase OafA/YrhL